jgi:hypothetical protein
LEFETSRANVVGGANFGNGQFVEQVGLDAHHPGVWPVPLIWAGGEHVAAEFANTHGHVWHEVNSVDKDARANLTRECDHCPKVGHGADQI